MVLKLAKQALPIVFVKRALHGGGHQHEPGLVAHEVAQPGIVGVVAERLGQQLIEVFYAHHQQRLRKCLQQRGQGTGPGGIGFFHSPGRRSPCVALPCVQHAFNFGQQLVGGVDVAVLFGQQHKTRLPGKLGIETGLHQPQKKRLARPTCARQQPVVDHAGVRQAFMHRCKQLAQQGSAPGVELQHRVIVHLARVEPRNVAEGVSVLGDMIN